MTKATCSCGKDFELSEAERGETKIWQQNELLDRFNMHKAAMKKQGRAN